MSLTEGDDEDEDEVGGVSKYHTHRTTTVAEPGQRTRSATGSVELPPMAQSSAGLRGGSIPPTPTLPPPLDLPSLSSTLGHQLPRPQLLPFALPVSPQRPNRHRLQPVSLSSDSVDTAPPGGQSSSSTLSYSSTSFSSLSSSKKLYRRTLSELLASQISESQRQQHQQPQQHHHQQPHAGTFNPSGGRHNTGNNNLGPHNNNHQNNNHSPSSNSPNGEVKKMGMSGEIAVRGERRNSSNIPVELKEGIKRGLAKQQSMSTPSSPAPTHSLSSSSPTAPYLSPARRSRSSGRDDEVESGSPGSPGKWPAPRRVVGPPTPEGGGLVSRREMARMLEVSLNLNKDLKKRVGQSPGKKELDRST